MDTKLVKYKKLWDKFEELLKKKEFNLSSFSKEWQKYHDDEGSDYVKFYRRIKKQKADLEKLQRAPQGNTIIQVEEYIKFLDNEHFTQELLDDERPISWFD